jgi:hypothetical protein
MRRPSPGSNSARSIWWWDWAEITNFGEFLETVCKSKMNKECLLIGIASDLLDLRKPFSAGVQFLIHKPASMVQIVRCLEAAHAAVIVKRRKQHREPVRIAATLHTRSIPLLGAMIVNLGSPGGRAQAQPDRMQEQRPPERGR